MSKVIEIAIAKERGAKMISVQNVDVIKGKGIISDRKFMDDNDKGKQITLIESENIYQYNMKYKTSIPSINFRRNVITKGIRLNKLVGKEFYIGSVKLEGYDLCRPCKYLQETLKQKNLIKEFLRKGGLRCKILSSGKFFINDIIKL